MPAPTPRMTPARWARLMDAWSLGANRATFDALVSAYAGRGRHYHTGAHVSACLGHLDRCLSLLARPREVELALWFHDAVYKPFSSTNEADSAAWARAFLDEQGADRAAARRVHALVMATAHGAAFDDDAEVGPDAAALVDIDLAILSADPATYAEFERAVRREYALVPGFVFRKKRAALLQTFLERDAIYTTACFGADAERRARANLAGAIAALGG